MSRLTCGFKIGNENTAVYVLQMMKLSHGNYVTRLSSKGRMIPTSVPFLIKLRDKVAASQAPPLQSQRQICVICTAVHLPL